MQQDRWKTDFLDQHKNGQTDEQRREKREGKGRREVGMEEGRCLESHCTSGPPRFSFFLVLLQHPLPTHLPSTHRPSSCHNDTKENIEGD